MANGNRPFNTMQANLGIVPDQPAPVMPVAISPAEAASRASAQASAQITYGSQVLSASGVPSLTNYFQRQFQQQYQVIQQQQSFNPYIADALAGSYGAGGAPQGGMLPSPLLMTPPASGAFRPRMGAGFAAIPPMPVMPLIPTPFTPDIPGPMFRTAWEQEMMHREQRADMLYSYAMQAPRAAGAGVGLGAGALAGAAVGGRFGPMGAAAGAFGGMALAGISGAARGMGSLFAAPFFPAGEIQQMGGAIQRMSQQFVVGGPQLGPEGRGFTREAGMELAQQFRGMAMDPGFKRETGGMFNREDLMRITSQAGRAGLLDMDQSTDQVRNKVRDVSRTLRRFMELTNDPDVTNVIRQMGQLQQLGMNVNDMEKAAQNMRMFSRAAGLTTTGIQQMGGLPGAATFGAVGLSPAAGFEFGEFALASSRQMVASGGISPRNLAMMGGVSGMAQRTMGAQAALMSMPLMQAAMAGYGPGGWGATGQGVGEQMYGRGGMGAGGAVMGALGALGAGVQAGGVGALAMLPLQSRFVGAQAQEAMSPFEQNMMRFRMAQQTGQMMGLKGTQAFAMGAQQLYGQEVAEQMFQEMRSPGYFRAQGDMLQRQERERAAQQRADAYKEAPGTLGLMAAGVYGGYGQGQAAMLRGRAYLESPQRGLQHIGRQISETFEDISAAGRGGAVIHNDPRNRILTAEQQKGVLSQTTAETVSASFRGGAIPDYSTATLGAAVRTARGLAGMASVDLPGSNLFFGVQAAWGMNQEQEASFISNVNKRTEAMREITRASAGGDSKQSFDASTQILGDVFGKEKAGGVMAYARTALTGILADKDKWYATGQEDDSDYSSALVAAAKAYGVNSQDAENKIRNLFKGKRADFMKVAGDMRSHAMKYNPSAKNVAAKSGELVGATAAGEIAGKFEAVDKARRERLVGMEKKLGLRVRPAGAINIADQETGVFVEIPQLGEVSRLAGQYKPIEFAAMATAAMAQGGGDENAKRERIQTDQLRIEYEKAVEPQRKRGGKVLDFWSWYSGMANLAGAKGGDVRTALGEMARKGGVGQVMGAAKSYAEGQAGTQFMSGALKLEGMAPGMLKSLTEAAGMKDSTLAKEEMAKILSERGTNIPAAVQKAAEQATKTGNAADFDAMYRSVSGQGELVGEKTELAPGVSAGPDAERARRDMKDVADMAANFNDVTTVFGKASGDFATGAKLLKDAMDEWMAGGMSGPPGLGGPG